MVVDDIVKDCQRDYSGCGKVGTLPTRNVNLTAELDEFIAASVETGLYENASEMVRTALRTLKREEQLHEARLDALRSAISDGLASGIAEDGVFSRVRQRAGLAAKDRG